MSAAMLVKTQERVGKRVSESGLLNSTVPSSATDRRRLRTIREGEKKGKSAEITSNT